MGMFDYITCEANLPGRGRPPKSGVGFQTKDTPSQGLDHYTITADGQLILATDGPPERVMFDGVLTFYTPGRGGEWWEYDATFAAGELVGIVNVAPAQPQHKEGGE